MNTNNLNGHEKLPKLLIVGLGDVAQRALPALREVYDVCATQRIRTDVEGIATVEFDLDEPQFSHLPEHIDAVLYTAPPASKGVNDVRLFNFLSYLSDIESGLQHVVYISTSGVYGDCDGAWVDETCPRHPQSERAVRRADAEMCLQVFAVTQGITLTILRAPGIYALERLPVERVKSGLPVLSSAEDAYSNHIHADDLAAICVAALQEPKGVTVLNASDDLPLKMGDWFARLARSLDCPAPPEVTRAELKELVSPMQWSFMRESRRLVNTKLKSCLNVQLKYPSVIEFLVMNAEEVSKLKG